MTWESKEMCSLTQEMPKYPQEKSRFDKTGIHTPAALEQQVPRSAPLPT